MMKLCEIRINPAVLAVVRSEKGAPHLAPWLLADTSLNEAKQICGDAVFALMWLALNVEADGVVRFREDFIVSAIKRACAAGSNRFNIGKRIVALIKAGLIFVESGFGSIMTDELKDIQTEFKKRLNLIETSFKRDLNAIQTEFKDDLNAIQTRLEPPETLEPVFNKYNKYNTNKNNLNKYTSTDDPKNQTDDGSNNFNSAGAESVGGVFKKVLNVVKRREPRFTKQVTDIVGDFKKIVLASGVTMFKDDWFVSSCATCESLLKTIDEDEIRAVMRWAVMEWDIVTTHFSHVKNAVPHYQQRKNQGKIKGVPAKKALSLFERHQKADCLEYVVEDKSGYTGKRFKRNELRFEASPQVGIEPRIIVEATGDVLFPAALRPVNIEEVAS